MYVMIVLVFFFNDTATTEIYTLSLHDALPIYPAEEREVRHVPGADLEHVRVLGHQLDLIRLQYLGHHRQPGRLPSSGKARSEEHTSELQSRQYLVCRLLLEKKKNKIILTYSCIPLLPSLLPPHITFHYLSTDFSYCSLITLFCILIL